MAQTLKLKNFTNVAILKRIDIDLLMCFLEPYQEFLVDQREMPWPRIPSEFNYEALSAILMSPGLDTPEDLLDALYFVDSLSGSDCYDRILQDAQNAGIDLGEEDPTPEELTLRVWLADPNILERIHAEQHRVLAKKFQSFLPSGTERPDVSELDDATRQALEADLNQWFEFKKKGRGAKVFSFVKEDDIWFLVRHGQQIKREGTVKADGESGSVFYRPEKFDVLIYHPQTGELDIHADTKGEQQTYCKQFGKHLLGDREFFQFRDVVQKYTLDPLAAVGRDALVCSDVAGIQRVRLYELHLQHPSAQLDIEIRRADDVFQAFDDQQRDIVPEHLSVDGQDSVSMFRAKFKILFSDGRERGITIEIPNIASYDRESDQAIINEWFTKRGFILSNTDEDQEDGDSDTVLEVA